MQTRPYEVSGVDLRNADLRMYTLECEQLPTTELSVGLMLIWLFVTNKLHRDISNQIVSAVKQRVDNAIWTEECGMAWDLVTTGHITERSFFRMRDEVFDAKTDACTCRNLVEFKPILTMSSGQDLFPYLMIAPYFTSSDITVTDVTTITHIHGLFSCPARHTYTTVQGRFLPQSTVPLTSIRALLNRVFTSDRSIYYNHERDAFAQLATVVCVLMLLAIPNPTTEEQSPYLIPPIVALRDRLFTMTDQAVHGWR